MEDKPVVKKLELERYLCLPVLENPKYRFRFLFYNISENSITADKTCTHGKESLWIPVYLASDVFAMDSFSYCNKYRIHAAFRKQGLAAKLTFPRGTRLAGVPVREAGVWFYSIYGVIQAVVQYARSQVEQISVLETLMDMWKLRIEDPKLSDSVSDLTLIQCDTTVVPLPEDLKPGFSGDHNSRLWATSKLSQCKTQQSSYTLSSGCVVTRQGSKDLEYSKLSSEMHVFSQSPSVRHGNPKEGWCPESEKNNCQPCRKNVIRKHKLSQNSPSSSTIVVNEDVTRLDENFQSCGCDQSKETIKQDTLSSNTIETHILMKRKACGHLKNTTCTSVECLEESDLLAKLYAFVENFKQVAREHSECCLKECLHLLFEEFLRLDGDSDTQNEEINARKLWNSKYLIWFSRWIGAKFRLLVPQVIKKVDSFKKANFDVIAELPSERQLISQLFPPPMWELLIVWMGVETTLSQKCGENSLEGCSSEENIQKEHSLLLLLLEFANKALVSGVAHVLYPRFV